MEMPNVQPQGGDLVRVPSEQEFGVAYSYMGIVMLLSIALINIWRSFYKQQFIVLNALTYTASYYHYTGDFKGFIILFFLLPGCIMGCYLSNLSMYIAPVFILTVMGTIFSAFTEFLALFLIRAAADLYDDSVDLAPEVKLQNTIQRLYVVNLGYIVCYIAWTLYNLRNWPQRRGIEDLLLIPMIGAQILTLCFKIVSLDVAVHVVGVCSLLWAACKTKHVEMSSTRMHPAFAESVAEIAQNQPFNVFVRRDGN